MKKNLITILAISFITFIVILFVFRPVLHYPNSFLLSNSIDGIKEYYNFSYYLKYDEGIKFDGINYPYGDHLQYINSHPIYVSVLKFINEYIYPVSNYGVGILNLTIILSLLITLPFLFLILRDFSLPRWYAGLMTLIILFLTPQLGRIQGHYAFIYFFMLPMFWYFLIQFRKGKKPFLWGAFLILSGLLGGFISAYYVAFYAILILGVIIADLWENKDNLRQYYKKGLILLILALIPILVVNGFASLTDWVNDRPENPWGFYVFHANIFSIFLPFTSPLKSLLENHVNMGYEWEGRAYVGLPATLMTISIFITLVIYSFSLKKSKWNIFNPGKKLKPYLIAAILILLFSMCIPFKYGFGFILELLPSVKQFRALGRFSWIFYYVFTIYSAYFFYRLYRFLKYKKMPLFGILLLIFVLAFWSIDAGTNIKTSTNGMINNNDKFESSDEEFLGRFQEAQVKPEEFQAILFLPFANTCGDKLLFERGLTAFNEAMKCSYHTGIPIIQSFSPRLSFTYALSSIQMLSDSCIQKTRLDDMNELPLLLVCTKEELDKNEAWLKSKSEMFWEDDYISLSKLSVDVFETSYNNWRQNIEENLPKMVENGPVFTDSVYQSYFYEGFNILYSDNPFSGKGSIYTEEGTLELLNQQLLEINDLSELSFWLYIDTRKDNMPQSTLNIFDLNGQLIETKTLNTREVYNVYNHWARISTILDIHPEYRYQLTVKGKYVSVDDLLIRPVKGNIMITNEQGPDLYNNYPL